MFHLCLSKQKRLLWAAFIKKATPKTKPDTFNSTNKVSFKSTKSTSNESERKSAFKPIPNSQDLLHRENGIYSITEYVDSNE
jgi:hypothetical protein